MKIHVVLVAAILLASLGFLIASDWKVRATIGGLTAGMADATYNDFAGSSSIMEHLVLTASVIEVLLLLLVIQHTKKK